MPIRAQRTKAADLHPAVAAFIRLLKHRGSASRLDEQYILIMTAVYALLAGSSGTRRAYYAAAIETTRLLTQLDALIAVGDRRLIAREDIRKRLAVERIKGLRQLLALHKEHFLPLDLLTAIQEIGSDLSLQVALGCVASRQNVGSSRLQPLIELGLVTHDTPPEISPLGRRLRQEYFNLRPRP